MSPSRTFRSILCAVVSCGLLVPQPVLQAANTRPPVAHDVAVTQPVADVALDGQGGLSGRVLDRRGMGQGGAPLIALRDGEPLATAVADAKGRFRLAVESGGVVQLVHRDQLWLVRVWTAEAAPPAAQQGVLLVVDQQAVAGQISPARCFLSQPLVAGTILGLAVGVPILIHNSRFDRPSGS